MKRTPIRRKRKKPERVIESDLWRYGMDDVCAMRGESRSSADFCNGHLDAHHIIYVQTLRKLGHSDFVMDKRNRMTLCRHHHEQHHSGYRMVPREVLPVEVWEMAEALDLQWWLERRYQNREQAVTAHSNLIGGECLG